MRLGSSFGSAITNLLSTSGLVSDLAPYSNSTTSPIGGTATSSAVLSDTARVISVTNTTLITKILADKVVAASLPTFNIKDRVTKCVTTQVPKSVACVTSPGAAGKSRLSEGADYSCSTGFTTTTLCYADDLETAAFDGGQHAFTDVFTVDGHTVTYAYTTQPKASMEFPATVTPGQVSSFLDEITVSLNDDTLDRVTDLMESACLKAGFKGSRKRSGNSYGLPCDPMKIPDLERGLLQNDIGYVLGDVVVPSAWAAYFLASLIPQHVINRAYQISTAVSIIVTASQIYQTIGVGHDFPVSLKTFEEYVDLLQGKPTETTATKTTSSSTSDLCEMCRTDAAACYVDPNDPQGEDGIPPVWPFPTLSGVITTPVSFLCHQGVAQENSQTWCNCGKTRYVKHPMTYTTSYRGSTTVLTENCPYTTTPPPEYLKYTPPTNPPVSSPLIVTAAITNTFKCSISSSSMGDWQNSWCACPDGKAYGMTKHVYGIAKSDSTTWTTDTCGYTAPPSSIWTVATTAPPITTGGEAAITSIADVSEPGTYMSPLNAKSQKYDTVHWNSQSAVSIASKFCSQMSLSSKSYIGSDANTLLLNHKFWNGAPTPRSYPVPTNPVAFYPDYQNPKALQIRLTHDERACNSTQKSTGCHFDFRDTPRCEHWLLTAIDSTETKSVYDHDEHHFVQPWGMDWVPRVQLSGDGIVWQIDQGERCTQPEVDSPLPVGGDPYCFSKPYLEA